MSIIWSNYKALQRHATYLGLEVKKEQKTLEGQNLCKDSATGGQMAYLTYLTHRILKIL